MAKEFEQGNLARTFFYRKNGEMWLMKALSFLKIVYYNVLAYTYTYSPD